MLTYADVCRRSEEGVKHDVDERDAAEGDVEVGGHSMHNEVLAYADVC
jgi:hypothetical protein